ncbi:MAG: DNA adenine methylase [Acidobacteriota bacterium]
MPVSIEPRPFLKWAGGKRQLLPTLRRYYPATIGQYFEPFLGSGAVFFDLWNVGRLTGRRVWLTDFNADLIGCYWQVRDRVDEVIHQLTNLAAGHALGGPAHYYDVRDARFNPRRERWRATGASPAAYGADLAAMLIYLNRTGYNGLFRQNARGHLNVPAGRYANPRIADADLLRAVSTVLRRPEITLSHEPFDHLLEDARSGDFAYFDPPYAPITTTSSFHAYTPGGFGDADHDRLHTVATTLAERGVWVLLSNSTAPRIVRLYATGPASRAGLRSERVRARRAINSRASSRGAIDELLVTNVVPATARKGTHRSLRQANERRHGDRRLMDRPRGRW